MNPENILQLIQALTGGMMSQRSPDSYTGINRNAPSTINLMIHQQYANFAGSVGGPLGILMQFGKNFILPKDLNSFGGLNNSFSGVLFPSNGGTYANAFQNFLDTSRTTALLSSRLGLLKDLKRLMYGTYFDIVHKSSSDSELLQQRKRKEFIKKTENEAINVPKAFLYLLDPADIQKTMRGILSTEAGLLKWSNRQDPLDLYTFSRTLKMSSGVKDIIKLVGKGQGYGGFSTGAVSELIGTLSQYEDISGGASDEGQIKQALDSLKSRVKGMTSALAPLRDIFGNDIPSMISKLQLISGMLISTMTTDQIKSVSSTITDMSRYSNVSIGQMAAMGSTMAAMVHSNGGSNWAQMGAQASGAYAAGMLTPGTGAFGLTPGQYKANTLNMLASAQDSEGSQIMAMAYGMAKLASPNIDMAEFDQRVSKLMTSSGMSSIQAAKSVVADLKGISNPENVNIYEGQSTRGNLLYRISGRGARWASKQLWNDQLNYAVAGARQSGLFSSLQVDEAEKQLRSLSGADLAAFGKNSLNFILNNSRFKNLSPEVKKVMYSMINRQGTLFTQAASWSGLAQQIQQYLLVQSQIRQAYQDVDKDPSNTYSRLIKIATGDWTKDKEGNIVSTQNSKVRQATVALLGQTVLNIKSTDAKEATEKTKLVLLGLNTLGDLTKTADLIQYASMGAGKSNKRFQDRLKSISNKIQNFEGSLLLLKKTLSKEYAQLYVDRWTGGNKSYLKLKADKDLSGTTRSQLQRLLNTFSSLISKAKNNEQRNKAHLKFLLGVDRLSRINNLEDDKDLDNSVEGRRKKKTLLRLFRSEKNGLALTELLFKKAGAVGTLQYSDYKTARDRYSDGYDMKSDVLAKLSATLQNLNDWLVKNMGN